MGTARDVNCLCSRSLLWILFAMTLGRMDAEQIIFAVQTSSYMAPTISQIKEAFQPWYSSETHVARSGSSQRPNQQYGLVTFSEGVQSSQVANTSRQMGLMVDMMSAERSRSCHVNTLSTLVQILKSTKAGSYVFLFIMSQARDADAKDEAIELAQEKQIQVVIILTGSCDEGQPMDGPVLAGGYAVYEEIAEKSGGQVWYLTEKDVAERAIVDLLNGLFSTFSSNKVCLLAVDSSQASARYTVDVDPLLDSLVVVVSGKNLVVELTNSHQLPVNRCGDKLKCHLKLPSLVISEVTRPGRGSWTLSLSGAGRHSVRLMSSSRIHFKPDFFISSATTGESKSFTRPLQGSTLTMLLAPNPQGQSHISSVSSVETVALNGTSLQSYTVDTLRLGSGIKYAVSSFTTPSEIFYLKVSGVESRRRAKFTRWSISPIIPKADAPQVQLGWFYEEVGTRFVVHCNVTSPLPFTLIWSKGHLQLQEPDRYTVPQVSSTLVVPADSATEEGIFTCTAVSAGGSSVRSTVIPGTPLNQSPPMNLTALAGEPVVLHCAASYYLKHVSWYKDGQLLAAQKRIRIRADYSLRIDNVEPLDSGLYICRGISEKGAISAGYTLQVYDKPEVIMSFNGTTLRDGIPVELNCFTVGQKLVDTKWTLNGNAVKNGSNALIFENGTLLVTTALPESEGSYRCTADYTPYASILRLKDPLVYAEVVLNIVVPPQVSVPQAKVLGKVGSRADLVCIVSGTPPPVVTWYREGYPIETKARFEMPRPGVLSIIQVGPNDAGHYLCEAVSTGGMEAGYISLSIGEAPFAVNPLSTVEADLGSSLSVPCLIQGDPKPTVSWFNQFQEDQLRFLNGRITLQPDGALLIKGLQLEDTGVYTCHAENSLGKAVSRITVTVSGLVEPKILKPSVDFIEGVVGHDVWLNCTTTGRPTPTVLWYRKGVNTPIAPTEKYELLSNGSLIIKKLHLIDAGIYTCTAQNKIGSANLDVTLVALVPPRIYRIPDDIEIEQGDTLRMDCAASGTPFPTIEWWFENRRLSVGNETLYISPVTIANKGTYQCRAINAAGESVEDIQVYVVEDLLIPPPHLVQEKPAGPSDEVNVGPGSVADHKPPQIIQAPKYTLATLGERIMLNCSAVGNPTPHVNWSRSGTTFGASTFEVLPNNSLFIRQAVLADSGSYNCKASNLMGSHMTWTEVLVQVHGNWGDWTEWTECNSTCGSGIQSRSRLCDKPMPRNRGRGCTGSSLQWRSCQGAACPTKKVLSVREVIATMTGTINGLQIKDIPLHTQISQEGRATFFRVVLKVPASLIRTFYSMNSMLVPMIWSSAYQNNGAMNGYDLTQGSFSYSGLTEFKSGESFYVVAKVDPVSADGILRISYYITGRTPDHQQFMLQSFRQGNLSDSVLQYGAGMIRGFSRRSYSYQYNISHSVDVPYSVHYNITYGTEKMMAFPYQILYMYDQLHYVEGGDSLRINMRTRTENGEACPAGFTLSNNVCQDVNECIDSPCEGFCINTYGSFQCQCAEGFSVVGGTKCEDYDECRALSHICPPNRQCVNTIGSYSCIAPTCAVGYLFSDKQDSCLDLDECLAGQSPCEENEECINFPGSYVCMKSQCLPGYEWKNRTCVDVDECRLESSVCPTGQLCINVEGSFTCTVIACDIGFQFIAELKSCEDIDECAMMGSDLCSPGSTCINTPGSYSCFNSACDEGYIFNTFLNKCEDIDECIEKEDICPMGLDCINQEGGYICSSMDCATGFTMDRQTNMCTDIDECAVGIANCRPSEICVNEEGSFSCKPIQCSGGFTPGTSGDCEDINECLTDKACNPTELCLNTNGSFSCLKQCSSGYRRNEAMDCEDVDECKEGSSDCLSGQLCQNLNGSYSCSWPPCPEGYRRLHGKTCMDVNECEESTHDCLSWQTCINLPGRFACETKTCDEGEELNSEGKCVDIDECLVLSDPCLPWQNCVNHNGGYDCIAPRCPFGYLRNLTGLCTDMNECLENTDICRPWETCVNTDGGFHCTPVPCPTGFVRKLSSGACEDVDECSSTVDICPTSQTCMNTNGSYTCLPGPCSPGYNRDETGSCQDVDECAADLDVCPRGLSCLNSPGSYSCVQPECGKGLHRMQPDGTCEDIDECAMGLADCNSKEQCINNFGSYTCQQYICEKGFVLQPDGECHDINECKVGIAECLPGQDCLNTPGSYTCQNVRCNMGHTRLSNGSCADIDECLSNPPVCLFWQKCVNLDGSFLCVDEPCSSGYMRDSSGECGDIDECILGMYSCPSHHRCINTRGSYECAEVPCLQGYTRAADGSCLDINECTTKIHNCSKGQTCVNLPGGFVCENVLCFTGYTASASGQCEDIDECSEPTSKCKPWETCMNYPGYYECYEVPCFPGHFRESNGICQDVDECALQLSDCPVGYQCVNQPGSFSCKPLPCDAGFVRSELGVCEDMDECTLKLSDCPPGHQCVNTQGSFFCQPLPCKTGFLRNKDGSCEDVDECALQLSDCRVGYQCLNQPGSFFCKPLPCDAGFVRNKQGICEDVDECTLGLSDCQSWQKCINTQGSFSCTDIPCSSGFERNKLGVCEDIDECTLGLSNCLPGHRCVNVPAGSFSCQPYPCDTGLTRNKEGNCEDIDECTTEDICSSTDICLNTFGSFKCIPADVIQPEGTVHQNEDLTVTRSTTTTLEGIPTEAPAVKTADPEDKLVPFGSTSTHVVLTTAKSQVTMPIQDGKQTSSTSEPTRTSLDRTEPSGLKTSGPPVTDNLYPSSPVFTEVPPTVENSVDEDVRFEQSSPSTLATLTTSPAPIATTAPPRPSTMFPCATSPRSVPPTHQPVPVATTSVKSRVSNICAHGFTMDQSGACIDINECSLNGRRLCHHICINSVGSYRCSCGEGFQLDKDGVLCRFKGPSRTPAQATCPRHMSERCQYHCTGTERSGYRCVCPAGYDVSHMRCNDKDECNQNGSPCPLGQYCANTFGSYRCINAYCPPGYDRVDNRQCSKPCRGPNCRSEVLRYHAVALIKNTQSGYRLMDLVANGPSQNGAHGSSRVLFSLADGRSAESCRLKSAPGSTRATVYTARPMNLSGDLSCQILADMITQDGRLSCRTYFIVHINVGEYEF